MSKQLLEASRIAPAQLTGKTWKIKVIEGDRQGSSAYYPKEALEAGKHLFGKGVRIFRNHPSSEAKWSQPERRIEDIIGWLSEDATYDGKDLYAEATFIESEQPRIKELAEAGVIAMSIRAEGEMTEGTNGMELKKFTAVHSVDVVTTAGAGGAFESLLESARKVSASESVAESQKKEEKMELPKEFTDALDALVESGKNTAIAVAALVEAKAKEEKAKADALVEAEKPVEVDPLAVVAKLAESKLGAPSQARVLEAHKGGKALDEAIADEQKYVKDIAESAREFHGNGSEEKLEEAGSKIGSSIFGIQD